MVGGDSQGLFSERCIVKLIRLGVALLLLAAGAATAQPAADSAPQAQQERMRVSVCLGCHRAQYDAILGTAHWKTGDPRTPAGTLECAACHGDLEEHVLSAGDPAAEGIRTYTATIVDSAERQNARCVGCHRQTALLHWPRSAHAAEDVGCVGCHRVHETDKVLSRTTESAVCFTCHTATRAQSYRPYGHPLREGLMACSDCHGPHGGPGDADLKTFGVNETCYDCHAEKRGPFLWEHVPASEDCLLCHSAHGSVNRAMLARRQPHLCQSCHEPTAVANNPLGPHARHSRLALSFREPGLPDQGPSALPGSRGISRLVMGEACSNCHSQVHGSNHPAGSKLTR